MKMQHLKIFDKGSGQVEKKPLIKFNPKRFEENSPEWNSEMVHYLLYLKSQGYRVGEVSIDMVLFHYLKNKNCFRFLI